LNGLANWNKLIKALGVCFVVAFLAQYLWAPPKVPSIHAISDLYEAFGSLSQPVTGAVAITTAVFWLFIKWGWRRPIFRKLGFINFPDLSGTWYAVSHPPEWRKFTTVVAINHSFHALEMTLIRNQSIGKTLSATLVRTETKSARLFVIYYSFAGIERELSDIPAVDHGEDHSGALYLDLNDESLHPKNWVLRGQYWTNKPRIKNDANTRGTWGRLEMRYERREPALPSVKQLPPQDKTWLIEPPPEGA
jgi:hypothetical protein